RVAGGGVGMTEVWGLGVGLETRLVFGLPPPQSPPISTLPPPRRPEASMRALATLISSPLTRMVPPWVPFFLPAAESVPEILMVWVGAPAGLLAPVAALSTIMPLRGPMELALITPLVLMTEPTTTRAAAALSSTGPPSALILPSSVTSDL